MDWDTAFDRAWDWSEKTLKPLPGWLVMIAGLFLLVGLLSIGLSEWMVTRDPRVRLARRDPVEVVYVPVLDIPIPTVVERDRNAHELEFLQLLNAERVELGRTPLTLHSALSTAADIRVQDQSERHYYGHYGPQDREMAWRVQVASVWRGDAGECCWICRSPDCGRCDMDDAVAGFKASPGHWNALTGRYEWIGISIQDLGGIRYFTIEVGNE